MYNIILCLNFGFNLSFHSEGSTSSPVSSTPEATRTSDAAAELNRLSRTPVKPPSTNNST